MTRFVPDSAGRENPGASTGQVSNSPDPVNGLLRGSCASIGVPPCRASGEGMGYGC